MRREKTLSQHFPMHAEAHTSAIKMYGDVGCYMCNEAADLHQHICHDSGVELPRDLYNHACKHTHSKAHTWVRETLANGSPLPT